MEMQHNDLAEQAMLSGDIAVAEQGVQLVAGGMKLPSIKVYKDNDCLLYTSLRWRGKSTGKRCRC